MSLPSRWSPHTVIPCRRAELDVGQKFWWMDWNRMIRDAITAMRTGEPVLYDDDE
jgi:hypothetical protein